MWFELAMHRCAHVLGGVHTTTSIPGFCSTPSISFNNVESTRSCSPLPCRSLLSSERFPTIASISSRKMIAGSMVRAWSSQRMYVSNFRRHTQRERKSDTYTCKALPNCCLSNTQVHAIDCSTTQGKKRHIACTADRLDQRSLTTTRWAMQ
jgi:hypothetical protein